MRIVACSTVLAFALVTRGALADGPSPKPAPTALMATTVADLKSNDASKLRAALDDVRMGGKANAHLAPTIAVTTLGDLENEAGSTVLASYAQHRSLKVRQAAVRSLIKTKGAVAIRALRRGLSDPDPMIRGVAANGLGVLKAKDALLDLSVALDHGINEAAISIGVLCGPAECDALSGRLGKLPFDVVSGGLDQALFRADLAEDSKIKIIGKMRELGTAEANKYLRDAQKRAGSLSPRLKQAIDQAVSATPGGA